MNAFDIDDLLEQLVLEGRQHFSPHYMCQRLGISDIDGVADYLLSLANVKLIPYYEVECPEGDSDFIIPDPTKLEQEPRICRFCGTEYIPDPNRIWLAFDFTKSFIDHVKKKKERSCITIQSKKTPTHAVM